MTNLVGPAVAAVPGQKRAVVVQAAAEEAPDRPGWRVQPIVAADDYSPLPARPCLYFPRPTVLGLGLEILLDEPWRVGVLASPLDRAGVRVWDSGQTAGTVGRGVDCR